MSGQNSGAVWVSWPGGVGAPTKVPIGGGKRKAATRKNRKASKKSRTASKKSRKAAKKSRGTRRR
jgi:hypothetical protein